MTSNKLEIYEENISVGARGPQILSRQQASEINHLFYHWRTLGAINIKYAGYQCARMFGSSLLLVFPLRTLEFRFKLSLANPVHLPPYASSSLSLVVHEG